MPVNSVELYAEAERRLGGEITPDEMLRAEPHARRKLDWIISREGDADGERRKPYYLAQLIAEIVRQNRFSDYLMLRYLEHETGRQTGIKKETAPESAASKPNAYYTAPATLSQ